LAASLVTALLGPQDRKILAELMSHSETMQQKTYNDLHLSTQKVRMSKILTKLLAGQPITTADLTAAEYGM
jgi:hypothetical protein